MPLSPHACPPATEITPADPNWPRRLTSRLGADSPPRLHLLGNPALLAEPLTALFCSGTCPGEAIVRAYDQAGQWRDAGRAVISGFHSPMEHECLKLLLRGPQPVVLCPARGLPSRLAPDLLAPLEARRLLVLTAFPLTERRATRELAARRNLLVAALAEEVWIAHASPGGQMDQLARRATNWGAAVPSVLSRSESIPRDDLDRRPGHVG